MKGEKKQTYTYATFPSRHEKARKKAEKEGSTLSEVIDRFLDEYAKPKRRTLVKEISSKDIIVPDWIKQQR